MSVQHQYRQWLEFDDQTRAELLAISDQHEIEDRFYRDLEFGTGGLRGLMGAGTNRMNRYTVRKATQGIADYLENCERPDQDQQQANQYPAADRREVVVAYDSRSNSRLFAEETAQVLSANGIRTFLFEQIMPTPVLSFAVKYLGCDAGIVITASHNPKEYNGYKVYDRNGCQLIPKFVNQVIEHIKAVKDYQSIETMDLALAANNNLFVTIGLDVLEAFLTAVARQSLFSGRKDLKIVYTPLHGSGLVPIREILKPYDLQIVAEQALPDGEFPTVRSPNPEEKDALALAIKQAGQSGAALVLGTDPDCDRVGVAVHHRNEYILLTGNQIGALLVDFVLKDRPDAARSTSVDFVLKDRPDVAVSTSVDFVLKDRPDAARSTSVDFVLKDRPDAARSTLVKTIVTNDLGARIARRKGLAVVETLTGFKYIGDQISQYERTGEHEFVIGYEESFGYLVGTHARDKDAVVASMLIAEMAAYWQTAGKTLLDRLNDLYSDYGYYLDDLDAFTLTGIKGMRKIAAIMARLRSLGLALLPGINAVNDYSTGLMGLEPTDVLKFCFDDGSWMAIRPSGTEPKIKIYYSIQAPDREAARLKLDRIKTIVHPYIR